MSQVVSSKSSISWLVPSPPTSVRGEPRCGETYTQPVNDVGVGRIAGAASVLLVTSRLDQNRVVQSSLPRCVQRAHVEDINALHLSEDFQTLQTSGLLDIGRDGTSGSTGSDKVILGLDICVAICELA